MAIWLVYDNNRKVEGVFDAEADATAQAALAREWTASPQLADSFDKTQPGQFYLASGVVANDPPLTALDGLKIAVVRAQQSFATRFVDLQASAVGHDPDDFVKGHRFLHQGLAGLYVIARDGVQDKRGRARPLSVAQRLKVADALPEGALDGVDIAAFYDKASAIAVAPRVPTVWVDLTDGATFGDRVNLAAAVEVQGDAPAASVDLLSRAWVDAIAS